MSGPDTELDWPLVARLRQIAADRLAARRDSDNRTGSRLAEESERQLARAVIAEELETFAGRRLAAGQPPLGEDDEEVIGQAVYDALFGLGRIQPWLEHEDVTDVHINGCDEVFVRSLDGTRTRVPPVAGSDDELVELIRLAAARLGRLERRFDPAAPMLNLELPDGSRLFAVMAVSDRPSVAIRIHRYPKLSLGDLCAMGMLDEPLAGFLGAAVRARANLIVAGGTGVGKTTLLRGLAHEIPAHERIVTVEDTRELGLHRLGELHPNVVSLEERAANVQGEGAVSLSQLVRSGLRMDPDRVIVGEVRGDEVLPMLNAMSQGNEGSMCTIHADSSAGAFAKLAMYALQTPQQLPIEATNLLVANSIDFVVFLSRGGDGARFVSSVREVVGADGRLLQSNEVLRPGADGRATPTGVPLTQDSADALATAGFDPRRLRTGWSS